MWTHIELTLGLSFLLVLAQIALGAVLSKIRAASAGRTAKRRLSELRRHDDIPLDPQGKPMQHRPGAGSF